MIIESNKGYLFKRVLITFMVLVLVICSFISVDTRMTVANSLDIETASGNNLQAWNANLWTQTSQADFEAGISSQVDTTTSTGDVILGEEITPGIVASDDFESGDWTGGS